MPAKNVTPVRISIRNGVLLRSGTNVLFAAMALAAFYTIDPMDSSWGLERIAAAKYAPVLLSILSVPFFLLGARGFPWREPTILCCLLFAVFVLGGGGYTILSEHVPLGDSFVGRGLSALSVFPAYLVTFLPKERRHLVSCFAPLVATVGAIMLIALVVFRLAGGFGQMNHIYHEEAVYFAMLAGGGLASRTSRGRTFMVVIFSIASALTIKLTGFAFAGIGLAALLCIELTAASNRTASSVVRRRLVLIQGALLGALLVIGAAAIYSALLPSGSPEVRMHTYTERWELFQKSPLIGQMFVGSPIMEAGWLIIPSHSDLLDILAFGGVVGGLLFVLPCLVAIRHGFRRLRAYAAGAARIQLASVVFLCAFFFELTFNPVLQQPKLVLFFWLALGVLLADRRIGVPNAGAVGRESGRRMSGADSFGRPS